MIRGQDVAQIDRVAAGNGGRRHGHADHVHIHVRGAGDDGGVDGLAGAGVGHVEELKGDVPLLLDLLDHVEHHVLREVAGVAGVVIYVGVGGVIEDIPGRADHDVAGFFGRGDADHGEQHQQRQHESSQFLHISYLLSECCHQWA